MQTGVDFMSSQDESLSEDIQKRGIALLSELKAEAIRLGASRFASVATEVFRKAKNGERFISRLQEATGVPVTLVTQELESELGFRSVVAVSGQDPLTTAVWDSGGSSMQISRLAPGDASQIISYMAPLGTSVSLAALFRDVRLREMPEDVKRAGAVNPVSKRDAESLVEVLASTLPRDVPAWLRERSHLTAAAGANSIFKLCCDVLSVEGADEVTEFSLADALAALDLCVDRSDDQLLKYQQFEYAEGTHVIVPKLALLVAVMRRCEIETVNIVSVHGSCPGLLTLERFWV